MPRDSFPRALGELLIGDAAAGYGGLGVLAADLRVGPVGGFYEGAIKAWAILNPRIRVRPGERGSILCNPGVFDNQAIPLGLVPVLERLAITTIVRYSMVCECTETCGTGTNYGVL